MRPVHDEYGPSYPTQSWANLAVRTNFELNELIVGASHTDESDRLKDLKASMPDVYLPGYWEELLPHFFLGGSPEPDWYIANRFVKHFHSIGTIDAFLDSLGRHPSLRASIDGTSQRWVAFFDRAQAFFGEQERLQSILRNIYLEQPAAQRMRRSSRELAESFVAYQRWKPLSPKEFVTALGCEGTEQQALLDEIVQVSATEAGKT